MPISSVCPRLQSLVDLSTPRVNPIRLVVFDPRVQHLQMLLAGLQPNIQAHVLAPERDGIDQVSALLCKLPTAELTLVTTGFSGGLCLGASRLELSSLPEYEHQLRGWFVGVESPELSLLSGGVAKGVKGQEFIAQLTSITGAVVRASAQPIGQGHWLTATAKKFKTVVIKTNSATL